MCGEWAVCPQTLEVVAKVDRGYQQRRTNILCEFWIWYGKGAIFGKSAVGGLSELCVRNPFEEYRRSSEDTSRTYI